MTTSRLFRVFALLCVLVPGARGPVLAQQIGPATEYATWSVDLKPETVPPGERVTVRFDVALEEGWKMYAMDSPRPSRGVEIAFDALPEGLERVGDVRQLEPNEGYDPNFKVDVRYFEEQASFEADVAVDASAAAGAHRIGGTVTFMICNATLCLPPTRVPFAETVTVQASAGSSETSGASAPTGSSTPVGSEPGAERRGPPDLTGGAGALGSVPDSAAVGDAPGGIRGIPDERAGGTAVRAATADLDAARAGGLWGFVLLAVGAGLAALLTPCVFPMIPLTVSYFAKHSGSRSASVRMALVYGFSIVLTFTALGVLTAFLVGAAGAQTIAANPWINLFIGAIFVVFALSLLGLFELRLPNGLLNYFNRQSNERGGYLGVLFMGLTLTLVSFSCTAPFVGGLLAATASDEWAYPILGMLLFSATFSLPFVVFALFPNGLSSLPKSGAWMSTVKVTLGFVELAAALKFLSNADLIWGWGILSRPLAIAIVVVVFFLAGLYLIGKLQLRHDPPAQEIGVVQLLFAILFFGTSLYMLPGLFGAPLNGLDAYLPPRQATDVSLLGALPRGSVEGGETGEEGWHADVEAALAEGRAARKPVFIDFTGYTCTNCRQMETNVFPRAEVAERFTRDFVLLRLYTDDAERGPDLQRYQLQLTGTVALPTYAIVDPFSQDLIQRRSGVASVGEFVAFLDRGTTSFLNRSLAVR